MSQHGNTAQPIRPMTLEQVAASVGVYPLEAYEFVQRGLHFTVGMIHNGAKQPRQKRHVSGQELAEGLRAYAHIQWGLMARAVLAKWQIKTSFDFGRIVFAMVDAGILLKTDRDNIEDFKNVFEFSEFDRPYRLESRA